MKKKVLFVGSFISTAKDGSVGGQMFACKSLINSNLSKKVEWLLLDTTGISVPPPNIYLRFFYAFKRLLKFVFLIIFKRPNTTLIFTANFPSIIEKGLMVIIASCFKVKTILAPRGGPLSQEIDNNEKMKYIVSKIFQSSNYIICQGEFWKSFFVEKYPNISKEKFIIIPNWINTIDYFTKFNLIKNNNEINLLFMGWIQEDKGIFVIQKALFFLNIRNKKINFYFLGDGPDKNNLSYNLKTNYPEINFIFTSWVYGEDKLLYLQKADIFILPSFSEGLPNSLMEAMLVGVASIATNVGSVSDLIINNETGILIDVNDHIALANGINKYANNENFRNTIITNARNRINMNHSITSAENQFSLII